MGTKRTILGAVAVSPEDWNKVSSLAKEGLKSRSIIANIKKQVAGFLQKIKDLTHRLAQYEGAGVTDMMKYYEAQHRAPRRLAETVEDIRRQPPERNEPERMPSPPVQKRNTKAEL